MAHPTHKSNCQHCKRIFHPDPRNVSRQRFCSVCGHRGSEVRWFSVEPGEIGLPPLEGTGDGINQHAKGGLAQLTAGLA